MLIIGCDYHPSMQQIAYVDTETGEGGERQLMHRDGEAGLCLDAQTESPESPRHVTVLHVDPVTYPGLAVREAIVQEVTNLGTADTE